MPYGPGFGQNHKPDHAAATAVPLDGLAQGALDELDALGFGHAVFPVGVTVAVDVGAAGASDGVGLLVERATERDAVDRSAVSRVVACDYHSGARREGV